MRLLFVIDSFGSGGAQRQMTALSAGLRKRGHDVEYFVYHPRHDHFRPEGVVVHGKGKASRWSLRPVCEIRALLAGGRFDAVLSYLGTPNLYAELAGVGLRHAPPLAVSERSAFPPGRLSLAVWAKQQAHRLADRIVVNSHHQRERMLREFPWMRGRILTLENGVDMSAFDASVAPPARAPGAPLRLLAVGRIDLGKNAILLARALAALGARGEAVPEVRWAGREDASPKGRAYGREVNRILAEAALADRWEWLGERRDVPALLAQSDALVHPSLFEGFPNAVCEAMAAGRPVLAGDIGDHGRLVRDGVTGFLFDPTDAESLQGALRALQALGASERAGMGRAARAAAEETFSMEICTDRYEALLQGLADAHRRSGPG